MKLIPCAILSTVGVVVGGSVYSSSQGFQSESKSPIKPSNTDSKEEIVEEKEEKEETGCIVYTVVRVDGVNQVREILNKKGRNKFLMEIDKNQSTFISDVNDACLNRNGRISVKSGESQSVYVWQARGRWMYAKDLQRDWAKTMQIRHQ